MQENLNDEQRRMEGILRAAAPTPPRIDRSAMMFAAGRASAGPRPRVWPWQVGMAVAAALCAVLCVYRPAPVVVERNVVIHEPQNSAAETSPSPMVLGSSNPWASPGMKAGASEEYLKLRNVALTRGLDAALRPDARSDESAHEDMKSKTLEGIESVPAWQQRSL